MSTDQAAAPGPDGAADPADDELSPAEEAVPWSRLNPRMLLVHPLRELIRYLPILLLAVVAGAAGGEPWWIYALSSLGIVIGILQYLTTTYRITPTHVQVRKGILNRRLLSTPRDRIRSVDVDSTLLHRIFGVSVVTVGTGASHGQDKLEFNAVATGDVPELRRELLRYARESGSETEESALQARVPRNLSHWQASWVRYAPFTLSGVASIVVVVMFLLQIQFFDNGLVTRVPLVSAGLAQIGHLPVLVTALWGVGVLVVLASAVAMVRYALSYAHFSITRVDAATLHISHGLLRTRQVTLDERRLRGISLSEPLSLRMLGASAAHAIMTGLRRESGGVALIAPPGPRVESIAIASEVIGRSDLLTMALDGHGPAAHRRRYTRAAVFAGVLAAIAAALELLGIVGPGVWFAFVVILPGSVLVARDRFRGLGHALVENWLVTQHGSLNRKRAILATEGIIGWTIRRSYFQRRAGLATLIATTAAGRHRYSIPDLPFGDVWPLIEAVSLRREVLSPEEVVALFARSV